MTHWIRQYGGSLLVVVLAFAYLTRMYNLHLPEGYMFDEVYHGATAKLIANNDPRAFEWWNPPPEPDTAVDWLHPPLAKYFQAASILAFGENSFGWRFSSVVFGVLVIVITYHLSLALFKNQALAVAAAALSSLDGLLLVQSRIAMNDIFVTFFMLLSVYFYVTFKKKRQTRILLAIGMSTGLAIASKWSGLFILSAILLLEGFELVCYVLRNSLRQSLLKHSLGSLVRKLLLYVAALIVLPATIYVLSYGQMFLQGKDFKHFIELHEQIWHYQTHLEATHPYQSRPWQWALNLRPVWYRVEYLTGTRSDVYAFGNPALFWFGLGAIAYTFILGTQYLLQFRQIKASSATKLKKIIFSIRDSPFLVLITCYLLVWI
ncbi:MAG: Dolichyl-phosphate-mannose--protein mannosyltransferase, partial [Patescibacteria group bacterium]|nr:Dolichyl-phosphate-mannose--protein mannosyltransferase [Patescibacteria group bacterium]